MKKTIERYWKGLSRESFKCYAKILRFDPVTRLKVVPVSGLRKLGTRVGEWVVPYRFFTKDSVCYCVGCGEDISFDLEMIHTFDCHVWAFDPTPRAIAHAARVAHNEARYHFEPVGVWSEPSILRFYAPSNPAHVSHSVLNLQRTEKYFDAKVDRLSSLMRQNGHAQLTLLKLDIEGAEYEVINSILTDKLDIAVLCVEFDEYFAPLDGNYRDRIASSLRALIAAGYQLVHTRGNGNYTLIKVTEPE